MAYTNIANTTIDLDSVIKEDWVLDMRDNIRACRVGIFGVDIVEDTSVSASYETVNNSTFYVRIPNLADYDGIQRKVELTVQLHCSTAATAYARLYDVTNAAAGAELTSTSTSYEDKLLTIDVDAGDAGAKLEYRIEFHTSTATTTTATIKAVDSMTGLVTY